MQELIRITESDGKKAVSARDLYDGLGFKDNNFTKFCSRYIHKNEYAIQNVDYQCLVLQDEMPNGGKREMLDFILSMDFAKKICMLARTEKGEQIRNYFIEVEKQLKEVFSVPQSFSDALMLAANQQKEIESQRLMISAASKAISVLQPKADLMDKVLDCGEKIDIGQTAKILKLPYGRNTLFSELRKLGVFFKERNEPKQEYIKKGYFEIYEKMIPRNSHDTFMVVKVLVTQRGLAFIDKLLNGDRSDKIVAQFK
jgi:phage anti-repressor protein/phage antirepressor YoqD-like protein